MVLSQKLKVLRKKMGLSQLELSEKLLVSRQAVSGWEAGTSKPSVENLQCLSRLYQVSLEDLLDDAREVAVPADAQVPAQTGEGTQKKGDERRKDLLIRWLVIAVCVLALALCGVLLHVSQTKENEYHYYQSEMEVERGVPPTEEKFHLTWE